MLVCQICGSMLVSDGKNWFCPRRSTPFAHNTEERITNHGTSFPDRRKGLEHAAEPSA